MGLSTAASGGAPRRWPALRAATRALHGGSTRSARHKAAPSLTDKVAGVDVPGLRHLGHVQARRAPGIGGVDAHLLHVADQVPLLVLAGGPPGGVVRGERAEEGAGALGRYAQTQGQSERPKAWASRSSQSCVLRGLPAGLESCVRRGGAFGRWPRAPPRASRPEEPTAPARPRARRTWCCMRPQ
jgi:hypothetical protein